MLPIMTMGSGGGLSIVGYGLLQVPVSAAFFRKCFKKRVVKVSVQRSTHHAWERYLTNLLQLRCYVRWLAISPKSSTAFTRSHSFRAHAI